MWTLNRGAAAWAAGPENEAAVLGSAFRTAHSRTRHHLPPQMSKCARFSGQFIPIARRVGIQTHRKAGSVSTENLSSEMQNRQRGAAQSQSWQRPDGSSARSAAAIQNVWSVSPCLARPIASCSEIPLARIFLAVVKIGLLDLLPGSMQPRRTPLPGTGGDKILGHCPSFVSKRGRGQG
jgi:hypothetical protein